MADSAGEGLGKLSSIGWTDASKDAFLRHRAFWTNALGTPVDSNGEVIIPDPADLDEARRRARMDPHQTEEVEWTPPNAS